MLVSIANTIMKAVGIGMMGINLPEEFKWVEDITNAIELILGPILIVVGSAGTIYAVVLGVNMARADSTEKREEAKKRLINVIVGIAIIVGLILFFRLLIRDNGILDQILKS
jgi:uncharacterized membrane protein YidH (DUF202 family)